MNIASISVPMDQEAAILKQLYHFAQTSLLAEGVGLTEHSPLADAGIDSYALVELLLFSERTFGVSVPESQLTRENLGSLAALARCIAKLADCSVPLPEGPR